MVDIVIDGFLLEKPDPQLDRSQFHVGVKNDGTPREELTGFKLSDGTAASRERLQREASILQLLDGGAFPRFIAEGQLVDGRHYLQMEFLAGDNLRDLFGAPMPPAIVLNIVAEVARGLEPLHKLGWVHRDLKPENIMIVDGRVRVVDLGSASNAHDQSITAEGLASGTPAYMAPEQIEGKAVGPEADCWALGAILYELCCGERPFFRSTQQEEVAAILGAEIPKVGKRDPRTRFVRATDGYLDAGVSNLADALLERSVSLRSTIEDVLGLSEYIGVPSVSLNDWVDFPFGRDEYAETYARTVLGHAREIVQQNPREAIAAANAALQYNRNADVGDIMNVAANALRVQREREQPADKDWKVGRWALLLLSALTMSAIIQSTRPRFDVAEAVSTVNRMRFPTSGLRDSQLPTDSPQSYRTSSANPRDQLAAAYRMIGNGQLLSAHALLVRLKAQRPFDTATLIALAHLYERAGDTTRARNILDEGLRAHPRDPELLYLRATLAMGREQESGLRAALAVNGQHRGALRRLCSFLANSTAAQDDALGICNRAVRALPEDAYVLADRAEAKKRSGEVAGALRDLQRAQRLAPLEDRFALRIDAIRSARADAGLR